MLRDVLPSDGLGWVVDNADWSKCIERDGVVVGHICMSKTDAPGQPPGVWIYDLASSGSDKYDAARLVSAAFKQARKWGRHGCIRANVTNVDLMTRMTRRGFAMEAWLMKGSV